MVSEQTVEPGKSQAYHIIHFCSASHLHTSVYPNDTSPGVWMHLHTVLVEATLVPSDCTKLRLMVT